MISTDRLQNTLEGCYYPSRKLPISFHSSCFLCLYYDFAYDIYERPDDYS